MAIAKPKQPAIEAFLTFVSGVSRVEVISTDKCMPRPIGCGGDASSFRDDISKEEYTISGLCQTCQDTLRLLAHRPIRSN